ncbi:C10 family peptidase [Parabacteroides sp.]
MKKITNLLLICSSLLSCSNEEKILTFPEMWESGNPTKQSFVSKNTAQEIANIFFADFQNGKQTKSSKSIGSIELINSNTNTPLAYVVNYEEGGWAIMSATKDYYPILAYSNESQFVLDTTDMNDGLKVWLDETIQAIESSENLDPQITSRIALEWLKYTPQVAELQRSNIPGGNSTEAIMCRNRLKQLNETYYSEGWSFTTLSSQSNVNLPSKVYSTADQCGSPYEYTIVGIRDVSIHTSIEPLVVTQWDQGSPYNALCPNQAQAGCVAIAMAQIMKFHRFPTYFNWNDMPNTGATYANQFLIAEVGKAIDTDYGEDSSGAKPKNAVKQFDNYGYNAILKDHKPSEVAFEIRNFNRPVFMCGDRNLTKGHAWICDGLISNSSEYEYYVEYLYNGSYDNFGETLLDLPGGFGGISYTTFHMNWGWGGRHDGWYTGANPTSDKDYKYRRQNIYVSPK